MLGSCLLAPRLAQPLECFKRHAELAQNFENQRGTYFHSAVEGNCNRSAIGMIPPLVASGLAGARKSQLRATR